MGAYTYNDYCRAHFQMDYHSVQAELERIMEFDCGGYTGQSEYYDHYREYTNTLSCDSGVLLNDLESLVGRLGDVLPQRKAGFFQDDCISASGIVWFNTAIAYHPDSHLVMCLLNEEVIETVDDLDGKYRETDWKQREKRMAAAGRLTKNQLLVLLVGVFDFLCQFWRLQNHLAKIEGMIDGMDEMQAALTKKNGETVLHRAAYL